MEKKLQKIYIIDYNLLVAQYLREAHYQMLSIIFLKEFIKLTLFATRGGEITLCAQQILLFVVGASEILRE